MHSESDKILQILNSVKDEDVIWAFIGHNNDPDKKLSKKILSQRNKLGKFESIEDIISILEISLDTLFTIHSTILKNSFTSNSIKSIVGWIIPPIDPKWIQTIYEQIIKQTCRYVGSYDTNECINGSITTVRHNLYMCTDGSVKEIKRIYFISAQKCDTSTTNEIFLEENEEWVTQNCKYKTSAVLHECINDKITTTNTDEYVCPDGSPVFIKKIVSVSNTPCPN